MRHIAVLDAPSNLGLRPPTATSVPGCAKAPGALRDHGLLTRLGARDAGCLTPPRYDAGDWRPGDGVAHAAQIAAYSRRLADRIGAILDAGEFPVILGGDCSILLGSGLAMHRLGEAIDGRIGLVFVDGHSDFRHPGNASYVGAAAGEDLALVTGRGQADLASIEGRRPYFRDIDVVVLGIRAQDEYRLDLQAAGIVTRPVPALRAEGAARSAQWARDQLADCAGYWVHVDVDVLDPAVMPAVDAPSPGGIAFPELELLLAGLVESPHCLGVELTVFDPDYDPDGEYAAEITSTVSAGLAPAKTVALRPDLAAARRDLDRSPQQDKARDRRRAEAAEESVSLAAAGASGVSGTPVPATTLLAVEDGADGPAFADEGPEPVSAADGLAFADEGPEPVSVADGLAFADEGPEPVSAADGHAFADEGPEPVSAADVASEEAPASDAAPNEDRSRPGPVDDPSETAPGGELATVSVDSTTDEQPAFEAPEEAAEPPPDSDHEAGGLSDAGATVEAGDLSDVGEASGLSGAGATHEAAGFSGAGMAYEAGFSDVDAAAEAGDPSNVAGAGAAVGLSDVGVAGEVAGLFGAVAASAFSDPGAAGEASDPSGIGAAGQVTGLSEVSPTREADDHSHQAASTALAPDGSSGSGRDDSVRSDQDHSSRTGRDESSPPGQDEAVHAHDDSSRSDQDDSSRSGPDESSPSGQDEAVHAHDEDARNGGRRSRLRPRNGSSDGTETVPRTRPRPLGSAPLLDSEPLPATRPGMLRPRRAEEPETEPANPGSSEGFSLPTQRPAFDAGSGEPADIA